MVTIKDLEARCKMYDLEGVEIVQEDADTANKEVEKGHTEEEAMNIVLKSICECLEADVDCEE